MCGITGIRSFNEVGRIFSIRLHHAMQTLDKRGPDTSGSFQHKHTSLGHCRLSVIDLSHAAKQPMQDPQQRYVIVFNGEIYNFRQIKKNLQSQGVTFQSNSDTEVLLQLYIHEKEKCLEQLNGFFAFAIYDKTTESLFIARDRIGIKPLWYYVDENKFIFASELQALLAYNIPKAIDYTSLYQYFQLSYIPAPSSIFKNVHKLLPGHYLYIQNNEVIIRKFYEVSPQTQYENISYEQAQSRLIDLLSDAVSLRLVSDVPLGAFLSGGIDSSLLVALASKFTPHLNTFSIGYKDEPLFDETHYANEVAEKYRTNHTVFELHRQDFYDHLFSLLNYMGEPFGDSSAIPTYILSQHTRKKVTVALSGDGADEIFGGYNKYMGEIRARQRGILAQAVALGLPLWSVLPKTRNNFMGNKIRQLHRFAKSMYQTPKARYWYLSSWRSESQTYAMFSKMTAKKLIKTTYLQRKKLLTQHIQNESLNEVLRADIAMLLPNDMLHKVDAMSMANSLEVRTPFLDHRLVNFAFSLPANYKIDTKMKKKVLQDAARHLLPKSLYKRPKHGFDVPLVDAYKTTLKQWIEKELLDRDFVQEQGVFDTDFTEKLKHKIFNTKNFDQNQIWAVLAFQHWWKKIYSRQTN